jgi:glyoxylase-like metal-dependent hydrolase (beta-lactamase superfamily II)
LIGRRRYRPQQWASVRNWQLYGNDGDDWYGFGAVRNLRGLPPEILLVPLMGHTLGHCGVAVDTGQGWLLHAGDAYFYRDEIGQAKRHCTPGLRFYQTMMEAHRGARKHNQERLRELSLREAGTVKVFCSHDAVELRRFQDAGSSLTASQPAIRAVASHMSSGRPAPNWCAPSAG